MRQAQKQSQHAILYAINPVSMRHSDKENWMRKKHGGIDKLCDANAVCDYWFTQDWILINMGNEYAECKWLEISNPGAIYPFQGVLVTVSLPCIYPSFYISSTTKLQSFLFASMSLRMKTAEKRNSEQFSPISQNSKATSHLRKTFTWFNHLQIQNKWGDRFWSPPR